METASAGKTGTLPDHALPQNVFRNRLLSYRKTALALVGLVLLSGGCNREAEEESDSLATGIEVRARLAGVRVDEPTAVYPGVAVSSSDRAAALSTTPLRTVGETSADSASNAFTVTLGEPVAAFPAEQNAEGETPLSRAAVSTTRADVTLENVWIFQFDNSGKSLRCENTGSLKAGDALEVLLYSGKGYTIGVVANGPAEGLSVTSVPDLATFREGLVFTGQVGSAAGIPLGGTLEDVLVLDNGQVQVGGSLAVKPIITLRRILAEVTVSLDYQVDGYTLDGVELYNVPVGAGFGVATDKTEFPASYADNFAYRDRNDAGLAPHMTSGGNYTWYIGDNRRGTGAGIATPQDKNVAKAPAYATYARVKTHYTNDPEAVLYYDIYLGADMRSDFNVAGNHTYTYRTRINGAARDQYGLLDVDGRVSGSSPMQISGATVTPATGLPALSTGILRTGGDYTVTLTGKIVEPVSVRAIAEGASEALVQSTAPAETGSAVLRVPANELYDQTLTVHFEYESRKGVWTRIDSGTQAGYGVTVTHTIPDGGIPRAGGDYTVTFSGDMPETLTVRARATGMPSVEGQATPQARTVTLSIPSNEGFDAPRTVIFEYVWNGQAKTIVERQQAAYGITAVTTLPASVPQAGATYTVTLTGELPSGVQARAVIGGAGQTPVNVAQSGVAVHVAVPANATYANRSVVFQYLWNGKWKQVGTNASQAGYASTGVTTNAPATIPQTGGTYTVTITGTIPSSVAIRAVTGANMVLATGTVTKSGTAASLTAIGANAAYAARSVSIEYQWNGTWTNIKTVSQAGYALTGKTVSPTTAIPQAGGNYTVTLTGTLPASVKIQAVCADGTTVSGTITQSGKGVALAIPANATYATRSVSFQYYWNNKWETISSINQAGYSVSSSVSPTGNIAQTGGTYTVTLTGQMPSSGLQARAIISGTSTVVGTAVNISGGKASVTVGSNNAYTARTVVFQYLWNGTWTNVTSGSRTQNGYSVTSATNCSSLTAAGGAYTITLTGSMPSSVPVRIYNGSTALASGTATKSGTAVTLTVPANWTGASRTISFQYQWNGTWTTVTNGSKSQPSYTAASSVSPTGNIAQAGGTYTVTLTGTLPTSGLQARAVVGSTVVGTAVNISGGKASVKVGANTTYANRTVVFQYLWNGTWTAVTGGSRTQTSYSVTSATHDAGSSIAYTSKSVTVAINGILPSGNITVQVKTESTVLTTGTATGSTSSKTAVLTIPENTESSSRTITIEYSWNGKWTIVNGLITQAETEQPANTIDAGEFWVDIYDGSATYYSLAKDRCQRRGGRLPSLKELKLLYGSDGDGLHRYCDWNIHTDHWIQKDIVEQFARVSSGSIVVTEGYDTEGKEVKAFCVYSK